MKSDLELIALDIARINRRSPEFRLMPAEFKNGGIVQLKAIVESDAVVRRPGFALWIIPLKEFDAWPLCDKSGKLLEAQA